MKFCPETIYTFSRRKSEQNFTNKKKSITNEKLKSHCTPFLNVSQSKMSISSKRFLFTLKI